MTHRDESPIRLPSWTVDRRDFLMAAGQTAALLALGPAKFANAQIDPADLSSIAPIPRGRALVIGINKTAGVPNDLVNPVNDAKNFVHWLVAKGRAKPSDITLLLSPVPNAAPDRQMALGEATRREITWAIESLPSQMGTGERFYFYYSGHGVAYPVPQMFTSESDPQDSIVPCDFLNGNPNPIPLAWIYDYIWHLPFKDAFFLFDACRVLDETYQPARGGRPPQRNLRHEAPSEFAGYATRPGQKTPDITGGFTDILLRELLTGAGTSKLPQDSRYVIMWERLVAFLTKYFSDNPTSIGNVGGNPVYLQPEFKPIYSVGMQSPVLTVFKKSEIPKVKLSLDVAPASAVGALEIQIVGEDVQINCPPSPKPAGLTYELLPQTYFVSVKSPGYSDSKPNHKIDLDSDRTLKISLTPAAAAVPQIVSNPPMHVPLAAPSPHHAAPSPHAPAAMRPGPSPVVPTPPTSSGAPPIAPLPTIGPAPSASGALHVTCGDSCSVIELRTMSGQPLGRAASTGIGSLTIGKLKAGMYRLQSTIAGGTTSEEVVNVVRGASEEIHLAFTPPPLTAPAAEIVKTLGVLSSKPLWSKELESDTFSPTILALAARVTDRSSEARSAAAKIGLKTFEGSTGGIRLIAASEDESPASRATLEKLSFQIAGLNGEDSLFKNLEITKSALPGIGLIHAEKPPGTYRLRFRNGDSKPVDIAIFVLTERICELIFYFNKRGRIQMTQMAPRIRSTAPIDPKSIRLLDRFERLVQAGQSRAAAILFNHLDGPPDPIVGAAMLHLISQQGNPKALGKAAKALEKLAPGLPDTYVALGGAFDAGGVADKASASYLQALRGGLPILQPFMSLLRNGIDRHKIRHPLVDLVRDADDQHIPMMLWAAWQPEKVDS